MIWVKDIQNLRCPQLIQVKITRALSKRSELEILTVVYIEMTAETTKVGEISEEYKIKNEYRPFKMLTVKNERRKGGQCRSSQIEENQEPEE